MSFALGLILAIAFPLLSLAIIRGLDLYQTGQFKLILYSLLWGAIACGLASLINISLPQFGLAGDTSNKIYYAPISEEFLKGLILLIMVRRSKLTYSFDGALYGFAVGIGFAIAENLGYIRSNDMSTVVGIAATRVISANLVHASGSAIVGMALGMVYARRSSLRWLAFIVGLSLAIGQHMIYNKTSLDESLPIAIGIGIFGVIFVTLAIQLGKRQARSWIKQKLGIDNGITRNEVVAVDRLARTDDILFPIVERFGLEKASQVEELLYLEARLGLKRKALDSFPKNGPVRDALEAEIRGMRMEIKAAQRAIGTYTMLFVRGLFTDEMISAWERIQAKIQKQSALTGGQKGGGLWSSLEEHIKTPADTEKTGIAFMEEETISQLKKINWFSDLPDYFFAGLVGKVHNRVLVKGEVLFNKGDKGDSLFIINSGRVKIVTQDSQEDEVILNQVGAGEVIGEMALLDNEARSAGVVALEETSIMELDRDDFMEILSGQPELALAVIYSLIERLRHNTDYIEKITDFSRRVAKGDYTFVNEPQGSPGKVDVKQDKLGQLMTEFIAMVRDVREREEELKEKLQKLTLQIDEPQRKQEVDDITNTDFYASLKKQAKHLRAKRKDNQ